MIDHLVDTDVSREVTDLYISSASINLVDRKATMRANDELLANTLIRRLVLPRLINRSSLIYDHVWNPGDSFRGLGSFADILSSRTERRLPRTRLSQRGSHPRRSER